jgi:hypothetical protein
MPDLAQSLGRYDLGYLQIVAEFWGIDFAASEFNQGLEILVPILLDPRLAKEMIQSLPTEGQAAITCFDSRSIILSRSDRTYFF